MLRRLLFILVCAGTSFLSAQELPVTIEIISGSTSADCGALNEEFAIDIGQQIAGNIIYRSTTPGSTNSISFSNFNGGWTLSDPVDRAIGPNTPDDPTGTYTWVTGASSDQACGAGADGTFVIGNPVFPVTLNTFTGNFTGKQVDLLWVTSEEEDNEGFEIQRSNDGSTWSALDFVPAATARSATREYGFTDPTPAPGLNYYRLKQMDFSGDFAFSGIVTVDAAVAAGQLAVFPNPVTDELNVRFGADEARGYRILSAGGAQLSTGVVAPNGRINVADLPGGVYLLSVNNGKEATTERFVKQ